MEIAGIIENKVASYFSIKSVHMEDKAFYFIVWNYSRENFLHLVDELDKIGYIPFIEEHEGDYKINIVNKPEHKESKVHINVILLLVTIISTVLAGYFYSGVNLETGSIFTISSILNGSAFSLPNLIHGISFSIALLAIIGTHESAHYFAAKKHGVRATLPYFIPAPTFVGTFGALINIRSAIPTRKALFDLGVSGPIAGFLVTIPVLIIGLSLSNLAPVQSGSYVFYPPLLMQIIMILLSIQIPPGYDLYIHPVAFAGWVGIIITMLNLMPVAVLDGGHISRSLFSRKSHYFVSIAGIAVTFFLGWYFMAMLMAFFLFFLAKTHPGALDNISRIDRNRKIVAVLVVIIFILCLSPMPTIMA